MLRLAEGVTRSRIMDRNGLVETIRLRITPSANRNSCRVARLVGAFTQGSVLRPQPWAGESQLRQSCCCLWKPLPMPSQGAGVPLAAPPHALPKGREFLLAVFEVVVWRSFPLGKVRMGLAGVPSPWGRLGWGLYGAPSSLGKAGMGLWMGLWMGLLCQCLGVDIVDHQNKKKKSEDGGDVDH